MDGVDLSGVILGCALLKNEKRIRAAAIEYLIKVFSLF
jgi:predicted hydrolase (HD superfamily)